jgi:hypothetical protein
MAENLSLTVKLSNGTQYRVEVEASGTVADLKKKVAEASSIPPEQQRLIFAGHILRDPQTLESVGIKQSGLVVHLVKSPAPKV